jgi:hypothetical protein
MTCSEPYVQALDDSEADRRFTESLSFVLKERKTFAASLGGEHGDDPNITNRMLEIRSLPVERRAEIYLSERINNQRRWYSSKAESNRKSAKRWFNAIMLAQTLALFSSLGAVAKPEFPVNLISIFAALAAALVAWVQLKRHQELANSYGLAAQELGFAAEQAKHIHTSEELSAFVLDSENAISREHTLWIARRDK